MTHFVLKFGGSSLCDGESLFAAATSSLKYIHQAETTIVVSATKGTTDLLLRSAELAQKSARSALPAQTDNTANHAGLKVGLNVIQDIVHKHRQIARSLLAGNLLHDCLTHIEQIGAQAQIALQNYQRDHQNSGDALAALATLAACGEKFSAHLFAAQLSQAGIKAQVIYAEQLIATDANYLQADIDDDTCARQFTAQGLQREPGTVYVIPGFTGACRVAGVDHQTTLLGRNASDFSAAVVARYWGTDLIIFGDTDGVYSSDPRLLPAAEPVPTLRINDAQWLASCGAAVIHPRTFAPLTNLPDGRDIKVYLRATGTTTSQSAGGTAFVHSTARTQHLSTRIAINKTPTLLADKAVLSKDQIELHPELQRFVYAHIDHAEIKQYSRHGELDAVTILLAETLSPAQALQQLELWQQSCGKDLQSGGTQANDALIIFAQHYSSERHALLLLLPHRYSLSCLQFWLQAPQTVLDNEFPTSTTLPPRRIALAIIGASGRIGSALLQRLHAQQAAQSATASAYQFDIVVLANSQHCLINTAGFSQEDHARDLLRLKNQPRIDDSSPIDQAIAALARTPHTNRLLIDATGSAEVAARYRAIIAQGIGIVTANKIANAGAQLAFDELHDLSRRHAVPYEYETTAGAALPLLQPLKNLQANADRIDKIQAVLSGTIGFVLAQLQTGQKFSDAVALAVNKGYAEPDPALDLCGEDVARKLLVILRCAGLQIEREHIQVQSLAELAIAGNSDSTPAGTRNWSAHDDWWQARVERARQRGKQLVYIAEFERKNAPTTGLSEQQSIQNLAQSTAQVSLQEIDNSHPFYGLHTVENAVVLHSELYHEIPFCVRGPGAGIAITSSGLLSDIHVAARGLLARNTDHVSTNISSVDAGHKTSQRSQHGKTHGVLTDRITDTAAA